MKILYIAHRIPFPPNKGDKIRSFHSIQYLSKQYEMDLICFVDSKKDFNYKSELQKYCQNVALFPRNKFKNLFRGFLGMFTGKPLSLSLFYDKNFELKIKQWDKEYGYQKIVVFSGQMCQYIVGKEEKTLVDFCDVDSYKWINYSEKMPFYLKWFFKLEGNRLLKFEKNMSSQCKKSIFITEAELAIFKSLGGTGNFDVLPNGVDYQYFSPGPSSKIEPYRILFTGAMDYFPNVDGVCWFASKIFPEVLKKFPAAQFIIAGSNPNPKVKELSKNPNIKVTGFVEDMRDEIYKAKIVVVPLRIARGMQNKVLEALSCGKITVAAVEALGGIKGEHKKHLFIAKNEMEFVQSLFMVLENRENLSEMATRARELILSDYNWEKNLEKSFKGVID